MSKNPRHKKSVSSRKYIMKLKSQKKSIHKSPASQKRKGLFFWILIGVLGVIILTFIFGVIYFFMLISELPDVNDAKNWIQAESTVIMDREGNELYTVHGDENRKWASLLDISPYIQKATVAMEDDQFYEHIGIDVPGTIKAGMNYFLGIGDRRGGSTITQQLAKNILLTQERKLRRKIKEIYLALQLERKYSKDEIFELYLNTIPYGSNAYGVESAANIFFGKSASGLTLSESTILSALPNRPSYYSPYGQHKYSSIKFDLETMKERGITRKEDLTNDDISVGLLGRMVPITEDKEVYIRGRTDFILRKMLQDGVITVEEKDKAWKETQMIEFRPYLAKIKCPHFVFYVKEFLEDKYGKEMVQKGGLRVYTTINPKLQDIAERIIEERGDINEKKYGANNAALVAIDTKTGQIFAMVGSRDYFDTENDGNVNVTIMPRLPGSSFKPYVYAAAFLEGYAPASIVYDVSTHFGGGYKPKNFDGSFLGPVSFRTALAASLNIPAVKAGYLATIPKVIELVKNMGVNLDKTEDWYGLSLSLGAGEVRLLEHTSAFSVFANNGEKKNVSAILRVIGKDGFILEEWTESEGEVVLDPQAAYLVTNVLSDTTARPAGWNRYMNIPGHPNAAKTGTSNKKKGTVTVPADAWTMGYTRHLTAGVWTGNNDGSPLYQNAAGLVVAGPIWHEFMVKAHEGVEVEEFERPEGIKFVQISKMSGKLPGQNTPSDVIKTEVFASFNVPKDHDDRYIKIEIDKVTELLASEECPIEAREEKIFLHHQSIKPDLKNWQNPVIAWAKRQEDYEQIPMEPCVMDGARLNKPEITIVAPINYGAIAPPSVGVWPEITSLNKILQVDFYFNDELMDMQNISPYKGTIRVPSTLEPGTTHKIRVEVIDEYYNKAISTIEVKIDKDEQGPEVEVLYPFDGVELTKGSLVKIRIHAVDTKSDVDYVSLYLDDKILFRQLLYPFEYQINAPGKIGEHILKIVAYDKAGNLTETMSTFKVIKKQTTGSTVIRILNPKDGDTFENKELIPVQITFSEKAGITKVVLMARKEGKSIIIDSMAVDGNTVLNFSVIGFGVGEYELFAKGSGAETMFSERVGIEIKN